MTKFYKKQIVIYKSSESEDFKLGVVGEINQDLVITELFRKTHIPEIVTLSGVPDKDIEPLFLLGEEKWENIFNQVLSEIDGRLIERADKCDLLNELSNSREITLGLHHHIHDELFLIAERDNIILK